MIANKYEAKNLTDHTVILKINSIPTAIQCGKTQVVEFFPKDIVLYPKGSLELSEIGESKSASAPKETEKNETITALEGTSETNEEIESVTATEVVVETAPEVEVEVVAEQNSAVTNNSKRNGRKTKDVKIETEEK